MNGNAPRISKDVQYLFRKEGKRGIPRKKQDFNHEEKAVLETIYRGKCLSFDQIMIYQSLKGYDCTVSKMKIILDQLIYHQLIQRITVETAILETAERVKQRYYMIGEYTPCRAIGITNVSMKKLFVLRKDCGSTWPLYCISMQIINQIALNQLIYNDSKSRFLIGEVRMLPEYKLVIPLEIASGNQTTAFIFAMYMDAERMEPVLKKWVRYVDENDRRLQLVIITRDDVQQLIIRKKVESLDYSKLDVGYTNYSDWFTDSENKIYIKTTLNALQA